MQNVRSNHPLLLEKFCPDIASDVISKCKTPKVRVRLDKPKAVMWTRTTAVEITRHRSFFPHLSSHLASASASSSRWLSSASASTSTATKQGQSASSSHLSATNIPDTSSSDLTHTAYIAIGSNVGSKSAHINKAMKLLDDPRRLYASTPSASPILRPLDGTGAGKERDHLTGTRFAKVEDTSLLYESEPMYYVEQDRFLNGVCEVS